MGLVSSLPMHLLGLSGSIRSASHNTAVLRTVADAVRDRAELTVFSLRDIPLYDADLDGDALPASVRALKEAIAASDGLVICSPEYNYGIPGVLKNAIDWASRPGYRSPLKDKPALIMTASPGMAGGVRAHAQIREALSATLARPIARQQIAIPSVAQKIDQDNRLVDATTLGLVLSAIDDLLVEVALLASRKHATSVESRS